MVRVSILAVCLLLVPAAVSARVAPASMGAVAQGAMAAAPSFGPPDRPVPGGPPPSVLDMLADILTQTPANRPPAFGGAPVVVPLPPSAVLLGGALVALAGLRRFSRSKGPASG